MYVKAVDAVEGKVFGRLVLLRKWKAERLGRSYLACECRCSCGLVKEFVLGNLLNGFTTSCGCLKGEMTITFNKKAKFKHGHAGIKRSGAYQSWLSMNGRCCNDNHHAYARYGGRGIKVCRRWQKFENFLKDMGERPPGLSLERKDNDGDYCPSNCVWADKFVQANNMRSNRKITFQGKTQTAAMWSRESGTSSKRIRHRIKHGWAIGDAISTKVRIR